MMVGGSIIGVSLAGRNFSVPADVDANFAAGGYENSIFRYGDGSSSIVQARSGPSISGLAVVISDDRGDREFLRTHQQRGDFIDVTVTLVSGAVWWGRGAIVGKIETSTKATSAPISIEFDGAVERQTGTGINADVVRLP